MKKIYIAGKIGDLPLAEYTKNFEQAKEDCYVLGYNPISPLDLHHNHGKNWCEYMREDLKAMLECDAVYCLRNWRHSPGAKIEIELALNVGLNIIHQ